MKQSVQESRITPWEFLNSLAKSQTDPGRTPESGFRHPQVGSPAVDQKSAVTWGKRQVVTVAFYEQYNDEAWVYITPEELRSDCKALQGVDLAKLNAHLSALSN